MFLWVHLSALVFGDCLHSWSRCSHSRQSKKKKKKSKHQKIWTVLHPFIYSWHEVILTERRWFQPTSIFTLFINSLHYSHLFFFFFLIVYSTLTLSFCRLLFWFGACVCRLCFIIFVVVVVVSTYTHTHKFVHQLPYQKYRPPFAIWTSHATARSTSCLLLLLLLLLILLSLVSIQSSGLV